MPALLALALLATAPAQPAWLPGHWDPYSNAFRGLGRLTVGQDTLSWHECQDVRFEIVDVDDNTVTLRLAAGSRCVLDDVPPTRVDTLRLTLRENRCDLGVTAYASPEAVKKNEPAAEGLYGKPDCPTAPANQAAANRSTVPR